MIAFYPSLSPFLLGPSSSPCDPDNMLLVSRFSGSVASGSFPGGDANCTMNLDSEDFVKMFKGELNPTQAFMGGKLKIKGDMMLAMKLEKLMGKMKSKL